MRDLFLQQANAKELRFLADGDLPLGVKLEVEPNFVAALIFKRKVPEIAQVLKVVDGMKAKAEIAKAGKSRDSEMDQSWTFRMTYWSSRRRFPVT